MHSPPANRRYTLLLAHAPNILDMMDEAHAVDLILCGHSHGGQWQISRGADILAPARLSWSHRGTT